MNIKVYTLYKSPLDILEYHIRCHAGKNANLCEHAFYEQVRAIIVQCFQ